MALYQVIMERRQPIDRQTFLAFQDEIADFIQFPDSDEVYEAVYGWNALLTEDVRKELEMIELVHDSPARECYRIGFCGGVIAMRHENGDSLPELSDAIYSSCKEAQDFIESQGGEEDRKYFAALTRKFYKRFPLTSLFLDGAEITLRLNLMASQNDIENGFHPGWVKAVKVIVPLFAD